MDTASAKTGRTALAVCVVGVIAAGLAYAAFRDRDTGDAAAPAAAVVSEAVPEPAGAVPLPDAAEETAAAAPPEVAAPDAATPPASLSLPSFDVVRVSPDGSALVAGRAAPGAMVTVMTEQGPLAEVEADAEGNFVAMFQAEPGGEPQALTLEAEDAEGWTAASDEVVMLLPEAPTTGASTETAEATPSAAEPATEVAAAAGPEPAEPVAAVEPVTEAAAEPEPAQPEVAVAAEPAAEPEVAAEPEPAQPEIAVAVEPAAAEPGPEPEVEVAAVGTGAAASGEAPASVAATAILRRDSVEAAPTSRDGTPRDVALASIAYAEQGQIALAGFGTAGSTLRVYVDEQLADEAEVGDDGRWELALGEVEQGVYRLRIDQLGADGRVASRVETPFQRDFPPAPRPGVSPDGTVTVQPGNNLWTLARLHYGRGVLYTQIYTANSALIRDPDLIYPGQILAMPEVVAE